MSRHRPNRSTVVAARAAAALSGLLALGACGSDDDDGDDGIDAGTPTVEEGMREQGAVAFTVRIDNVSTPDTLATSTGGVPAPLSPGAYVVHDGDTNPLFEDGAMASGPLEMVAEDGDPSAYPALVAGAVAFDTGVGAEAPGGIGPGGAFELDFTAEPGDRLSFVTMFVQSNDWFYAPTALDEAGIALFDDDGDPVSGDVSDQVELYDAGTEQDEEPGTGANQVLRQSGPDTGPAEGADVATLEEVGKSVELNGPVIRVTVTPADGTGS